MEVGIRIDELREAIGRKDQLGIFEIVVLAYQRHFHSEDDVESLLEDISLDQIGYVDTEMLYRIHSHSKINTNIVNIKSAIDKRLDKLCEDYEYLNIVFKYFTEEHLVFEIVE